VLIGGPGGRHPWAGYGHRSVAAAAVRMLARVLHGEARAFSVRLQLLEVESPVRTDANEVHACKQWPCVDAIGRKALALLQHRNDARCTDAVIDYRSDACSEVDPGRADLGQAGSELSSSEQSSSEQASSVQPSLEQGGLEDDLIPMQGQGPQSAPSGGVFEHIEAQEMDSSASLLPARCLQDVRKLLEAFTPTRKNQERTR
jgi:hypothetical protein